MNGDPHRVTRPSSGFKTWSGQGECRTHLAAHSGDFWSSNLRRTYLSGIYIVLEALKEARTILIAANSTRPEKGRIARYSSLLIAGGGAGGNVICGTAGSGLPTDFLGSKFPVEASFKHQDPVRAVLSTENWEFLSYLLIFRTHPVLCPVPSATL